jgi:hypothetical protein
MSRENVEVVAGLQAAPDADIAALLRDEATWRACSPSFDAWGEQVLAR